MLKCLYKCMNQKKPPSLQIRLGRSPRSNRLGNHILNLFHQARLTNDILPCPQTSLLQTLPDQRFRAQNHLPPSIRRQLRNLRPGSGMIAHLQNHTLITTPRRRITTKESLNHLPSTNLLRRLRRIVRNARDNRSRLLQTRRSHRIRNIDQRRLTTTGIPLLILLQDRLDLRTVPIDNLDLARTQPLPHHIHGRPRRAPTSNNQRRLPAKLILAGPSSRQPIP